MPRDTSHPSRTINTATRHTSRMKNSTSSTPTTAQDSNPRIMMKCTVKSPSKIGNKKKGAKSHFSKAGFRQMAFRVGIFPKLPKRSPRCATLIKSRILMALADVGERWQKRGQKWTLNGPNSTENIPEQFHPKSTKNTVNVK